MADTDACDLIEEWARGALDEAGLDLPDDTGVNAEKDGGGFTLTVEVPQGDGAQQLATSLQSALADAVESDPTLGGRFDEVHGSPAGVDLVGSGESGARSLVRLTLAADEESESDDEDDAGDDADGSDESGGEDEDR
jgi:hypothetical protein